jgi:hypothetical protein
VTGRIAKIRVFFNKLISLWKSCSFFALQLLNMEPKKQKNISGASLSKVKTELLEHIASGVWQLNGRTGG